MEAQRQRLMTEREAQARLRAERLAKLEQLRILAEQRQEERVGLQNTMGGEELFPPDAPAGPAGPNIIGGGFRSSRGGVYLGGRQKQVVGSGMWDWADPNKNGIANAFSPVGDVFKKTIPSFLIHQGLPAVGEFAGSKLGFGQQGRDLANMGANELGNVTGLGLKRFKKGSPEAKAFMKSLRDRKRK